MEDITITARSKFDIFSDIQVVGALLEEQSSFSKAERTKHGEPMAGS